MLQNEQILTFAEAAKTLPPLNGRRVHTSTIWRWARKGVQGIHLETRRLGGRFVTSAEALERFTAALAELPPDSRKPQPMPRTPKPRTEKQRQHDLARAERELNRAGFQS